MAKQKKVNRKAQFSQTICVFCNSPPLTEEHIFSDWIKKIIPRTGEPKYEQLLTNVSSLGNETFVISPALKFKQGHYGNQRVKVVCNDCNSGWMNQIEQKARPILTPLILGEDYSINRTDQLALSNWAILKTIIAEYTDIPNKAIRAEERKEFYRLKRPHSNWKVFVGRFVGGSTPELRYLHQGAVSGLIYPTRSLDPVKYTRAPVNDSANMQFSIFVIGQLLFYTFKSILTDYNFTFTDSVGDLVYQIHPRIYDSIEWNKIGTLSEEDYQRLRLHTMKSFRQ